MSLGGQVSGRVASYAELYSDKAFLSRPCADSKIDRMLVYTDSVVVLAYTFFVCYLLCIC
jgi:hypothetical protein